ncbi:MAG TPA: thioesterase family protein [Xanthobacteraceae bacterium]|jgi:4-hydroxybenzoyl-CoA thioesterase|nr:thioesterase family protein [Xanthobacteraceae bacterium]
MLTNTRALRIEWGDCDPAGIVFYPRYFAMFDASTAYLIERAAGMSKFEYLKAFMLVGHPVVETRAQFRVPTRFGDEISIESKVASCGRSSVKIEHRLSKGGVLAVEGFETRVFVGRDPANPEQIKSIPIPAEIAARLTQGA